MNTAITIVYSLAAGLHAACFGAYKDSPHEYFLLRRFVRELFIAFMIGVVFSILDVWRTESYLIIFLSTFTISRIVTEFYKLNLRVEPQKQFRIPTQIHFFGKVVHNRAFRIVLGFVTPCMVMGVFMISKYVLPPSLTNQQRGVIVGFLIGLADASGGAYKDGSIEGFYLRKFMKSSIFGPLGGFLMSFQTTNPFFHLLGTIAFMRMFLELLFKIMDGKYVPGKFKSMKPKYPVWSVRRKWFLIPYAFTWVVFVALLIS